MNLPKQIPKQAQRFLGMTDDEWRKWKKLLQGVSANEKTVANDETRKT